MLNFLCDKHALQYKCKEINTVVKRYNWNYIATVYFNSEE